MPMHDAPSPTRRTFLGGFLSVLAVAATGVDAATVPMIYGDGVRDDAPGIQAMIDGKPFRVLGGESAAFIAESGKLAGGTFRLSRGLIISQRTVVTLESLTFKVDHGVRPLFTVIEESELTIGHVTAVWSEPSADLRA